MQNLRKKLQKKMQIYDRKKTGQKNALKLALGASWAPFGRVSERFWEGFGDSWGLLGRFWSSFLHACIWNGPQKWSWKLLGSILEGLGGSFGGFWEGVGSDFGGFWVILACSGLFWGIGAVWDNLGRILAGAACLLACFCVPLLAIARYWLLGLAFPCFFLLWLPVAGFCLLAVPFVGFKLRVKGKNLGKPGL